MHTRRSHQACMVLVIAMSLVILSSRSPGVSGNEWNESSITPSENQEINITLVDPVNDVTHYNKSTGALIAENVTYPDFDILNASVTTGPVNYSMVMYINGHFNMSGESLGVSTPYSVKLLFAYYWDSSISEDKNGTACCTMEQFYVSSDMFGIFGQNITVADNVTGSLSVSFPRVWIPDIGNPYLGYPIDKFYLEARVYYLEPSGSFVEYEDTLENAAPYNDPGDDGDGEPNGDEPNGDNPAVPGYDVGIVIACTSILGAVIAFVMKRKVHP